MLHASTIIIGLAIALSLLRILSARSEADRVIALDVVAFQLLGLTFLSSFYDNRPLALQFAFLLSLLGFLSTVILARLFKPS